jgi:hypothetical protein
VLNIELRAGALSLLIFTGLSNFRISRIAESARPVSPV